jgi:hypothetical protein
VYKSVAIAGGGSSLTRLRKKRIIFTDSDADDDDVRRNVSIASSNESIASPCERHEAAADDVEEKVFEEAEVDLSRAREEYECQLESHRTEQADLEAVAQKRIEFEARKRRADDRKAELVMRTALEAEYQSFQSVSIPSPLTPARTDRVSSSALPTVPVSRTFLASRKSNDANRTRGGGDSGDGGHETKSLRDSDLKNLPTPKINDAARKRKFAPSLSSSVSSFEPSRSVSSSSASAVPNSIATSSLRTQMASRPVHVTNSSSTVREPDVVKPPILSVPPPKKLKATSVPHSSTTSPTGRNNPLSVQTVTKLQSQPPLIHSVVRKKTTSEVVEKKTSAPPPPSPPPPPPSPEQKKSVPSVNIKKKSVPPVEKKQPTVLMSIKKPREKNTSKGKVGGRGGGEGGDDGGAESSDTDSSSDSDADDGVGDGKEENVQDKRELVWKLQAIREQMMQSNMQYGQWKLLFDAMVAGEYDVTRNNSSAAASYDALVAANGEHAPASIVELTNSLCHIVQEEIVLSDNAKKHLVATMAQNIRERKVLQAEYTVLSRHIQGKSKINAIQNLQVSLFLYVFSLSISTVLSMSHLSLSLSPPHRHITFPHYSTTFLVCANQTTTLRLCARAYCGFVIARCFFFLSWLDKRCETKITPRKLLNLNALCRRRRHAWRNFRRRTYVCAL